MLRRAFLRALLALVAAIFGRERKVMATVPGWTGEGGASDADWNKCILGDAIVPGLCSIKGLKAGIDVDTKKARGADQPTSTDNGVKPSKFQLHVWLKQKQWPDFQIAFESFQPRRPGRARAPVQIIHPMVNFCGIQNVRVVDFEMPEPPTARGGLKVVVYLEEWFDKPKPVKKKEKPVQAITADIATEPLVIARNTRTALKEMSEQDIDPNTGKSISPSDAANLSNSLF